MPFVDLVPAGADPEPTRLLVKELADARLVVTSVNAASGQEEVEVAHEALIRYWQRLQGWLNEDRDALRLRQNLNQDAHQWQAANRDEALLPRWNARLEDAQVLARRGDLALSGLEQDYLRQPTSLRDREAAEKEAQRQRELEQAKKLAEEQQSAGGGRRKGGQQPAEAADPCHCGGGDRCDGLCGCHLAWRGCRQTAEYSANGQYGCSR